MLIRSTHEGRRLLDCSQLGAGVDVLDDDLSQALPGGEEELASQPLGDGTQPQVALRCVYGCILAWLEGPV